MTSTAKSRKNYVERQILKELLDNNDLKSIQNTIKYKGKEYKTTQKVKSLDNNYHGPNIQIKTLIGNIQNSRPGPNYGNDGWIKTMFASRKYEPSYGPSYEPISESKQGSASEMTADEFKKTIKDFLLEGKSLSKQDEIMNEEYKKKYKRDIINEAEAEFYNEHKEEIDKQRREEEQKMLLEEQKKKNRQEQYKNAPEGNYGISENVPFINEESDIKKLVGQTMADQRTQNKTQLEIEQQAIEDWKKEKEQSRIEEMQYKEESRKKLLSALPIIADRIRHEAIKNPNFKFEDMPPVTQELFKRIDYEYATDKDFDPFRKEQLVQDIDEIKRNYESLPESTKEYVQKKSEENIKELAEKAKPLITPSGEIKEKKDISSKESMSGHDIVIPPKLSEETGPTSEIEKKGAYSQGSGLAGILLEKTPLPGGPIGTAIKWGVRAGVGELEKSLISGEDPLAEFLPGRDQSETAGGIMANQGFEGSTQENIPNSFATETSPTIDTKNMNMKDYTGYEPPPSFYYDIGDFLGDILGDDEKNNLLDRFSMQGSTEQVITGFESAKDPLKGDDNNDPEAINPEVYETSTKEEVASAQFNNYSQPGTYVGTAAPTIEPPGMPINTETQALEEIPQSLQPDSNNAAKKGPTYKNAIHKNALIVYFGSYENPNWDWNLWITYKGLDIGQNKLYFLGITRSLFALHGTDLLIDSLVYNENSSAKEVFQEYMEVIELYKCFAGINNCSSGEMVKIPKQDFNNVLSTLSSGQLPIQDITNGIKSGKLSKKDAMDKLNKLVSFKKKEMIKKEVKDQFMDKSVLNTISNYELKQMQPTDIPRQHRKMWNGVPQIYNPIKVQQTSDRIGVESVTAIDNLNKGQIIMNRPNSIYVPAKQTTKKMHLRIEIPKE